MKMNKFLLLCVITSLTFGKLFAQKNYGEQAKKAYNAGEYFSAVELFKKASSKEKNKTKKAEMFFLAGECYRHINDYKNAEKWYEKAIAGKYHETDPIVYYELALMKKDEERYNDALIDFNKYKELKPDDAKGEREAKACEQAQKWKDNPTRYKVTNFVPANGKESDFSPTFADKKKSELYFTSTRSGADGSETDGTSGQAFSDIYTIKRDKKGKWSTPIALGEPVNSEFNEGAVAVNKKANKIFFTRCDKQNKKALGCQILFADKKGNGWGTPVSLNLCVDSLTVGHPSLSSDESTLYFASDIPGGLGGKDIWKITYDKKAKTWSSPVNLGAPINTPEDELYPYIKEDGVLYFSSNGHLGMGGMDIFKATPNGDGFTDVQNMQYPINSAADDFGILFRGKTEDGYLSSNREGGKGADDIWEFNLPPLLFTLQGLVTDVDSRQKLVGATVKLLGSDGSSLEVKTDGTGGYKFEVAPDGKRQIKEKTTYTINVSMEKYFAQSGEITTVGLEANTDFDKPFALKTTKKEVKLPEILYDLAKWDLKPQFQDSLNGLIVTLNDNQNIVVELGSHTDSRGDNKSNGELAQKRAQSVVDYLILKGIDPERLVAKGYGEDVLLITDEEINKVKDKEEQENMHAKNRRTTFKVIREDFVAKVDPNAPKKEVKIEHMEDSEEDEEEEEETEKSE
ncbi:MAG: OmpA family protein [Bacteroidota bacterium]